MNDNHFIRGCLNVDPAFVPGDIVQAEYKSGVYIGEVVEVKPERRKALVKVLAVLKHPDQGDLHHPGVADVPLFHQRKALAYQEKVNVPLRMLSRYEGKIPDYRTSLLDAINKELEALKQHNSPWAELALSHLQALQEEYRKNS
jgi:kinase-associated protein B